MSSSSMTSFEPRVVICLRSGYSSSIASDASVTRIFKIASIRHTSLNPRGASLSNLFTNLVKSSISISLGLNYNLAFIYFCYFDYRLCKGLKLSTKMDRSLKVENLWEMSFSTFWSRPSKQGLDVKYSKTSVGFRWKRLSVRTVELVETISNWWE